MRIAFVGAGEFTVRTAELLIKRGHEVIIVEKDEVVILTHSENLSDLKERWEKITNKDRSCERSEPRSILIR